MFTLIQRGFAAKLIVALVVISMLSAPIAPVLAQEEPLAPEIASATATPLPNDPLANEPVVEAYSMELPGSGSAERVAQVPAPTTDAPAAEPEILASEPLAAQPLDPEMSLLSGGEGELESTAYGKSAFSYDNLSSRVDNSTGALTQRVPIAIPPGRNGMQPEVALEYNSQRTEDGIVGYGWSVSIPYIERMNKFGSQTLYSGSGNFSSSIHGELATTSSATSTPTQYMARVDTGHATTYSYDIGTDTWTAYDKNGTRYRYGASSQSRQSATSTYKWMLEEIRDTNDNFVRYVYSKDFNQIYPSQILYTGTGVTDGIMEVSFATSSRTDVLTSYKPGFKVTTNYRVSRITASVSGTWVRKYDIGYTAGNNGNRSLLSSVTLTGREEGGTELSMPALTFEYTNTSAPFVAPSSATMPAKGASFAVADINGNARNDISVFWRHKTTGATTSEGFIDQTTQISGTEPPDYWAANSNSGWNNRPYQERGVRFLDVNADGKADVAGPLGLHLNTYTYGGSYGWSLYATSSANIPGFRGSSGSIYYPAGVLGDVNGDGLPDFARREEGGSGETSLGNGAGWDVSTTTMYIAPKGMPVPWQDSGYNSQLVDINADGLDDWVYSENDNTYVLLNNGVGWDSVPDSRWTFATSTLYKAASGHPYFDRGIRFLDINGDGYLDIVRAYKGSPQSSPSRQVESADIKYVYLNTGSGWATSTAYTLPEYIMSAIANEEMKFNEYANWTGNGQNNQDVLATTTYPTGGKTIAEYTKSAMLGTNPELPISLLVVTKLTTTDVTGRSFNRTYTYSGGKMYLADGVRERKFAGFYNITETTPHAVTRTYFNQGDSINTAEGEQSDGYAQTNRPFREDILDSMGAATLQRTYFRWDTATTGGSTHLGLGRKMEWSMGTAGAHKDRATEYAYSTTTRDLVREIDYGEINGATNGGFTDVLSDIRTSYISYAASSSINLSVPIRKEIVSATSSAPAATSTQVTTLVVAGGGGGGNVTGNSFYIRGGGGGGGGLLEQTLTLIPNSYTITVGSGGTSAGAGGNSSIGSVAIAIGGGAGGSGNSTAPSWSAGGNGGSGGGGVGGQGATTTGGTATSGQGSNGVAGNSDRGGGGGGCGAAGSSENGGSGCSSTVSGTNQTYAGGGGAAAGGTGGSGGGGTGGINETDPTAGAVNTGSGGGGGVNNGSAGCPGFSRCNGAVGGSGIVIIKYPTGTADASGGTITQSGGYTIHKFTSGGTFVLSTSTTPSSSATSSDEIYYYDNLSYGQVGKGNQTRVERAIDATRYASTTKTYNSLGLVTGATDARGKTTSYSYDAANYYPATVTNALSQATTYSYDYATGEITESIDPNGRKSKNVFDAVGRVKRQDQSDVAAPSSYVTKSAFTFVDSTTTPSSILRTDYLNAASTTASYEYFDGLGRVMQRRASSGYTGTTTVSDIIYDSAGQVGSVTLPYFASGTSYASPSATTALYTYTTYDAMQRPVSVRNSVGTTTMAYAGWSATTTDANGKSKAFMYDAFKNLTGVNEVNGTETYRTRYEYDASNNVAKITDALGNVRNFTYDRLGRRLTAQDLHAIADGTFGTWAYTYDDAGNLISQTDPKSQVVNRTYDDLSRLLTEDYTGTAGTEVTYAYDSCTNGIGYLCSASSTAAHTAYAYDPLGRVSGATTTIQGTAHGLSHSYDRQGNIASIIYPNATQITYTHNDAGLIDAAEKKLSGDLNFSPVIRQAQYAAHRAPQSRVFGNSATTTWTYDAARLYRLANLYTATTTAASSSYQDIDYTYDSVGNIIVIANEASNDAAQTIFYSYDDLNRLLNTSRSQIAETSATSSLRALVVGGGAAGGVSQFTQGGAGGGGAGGFLEDTNVEVAMGAYAITVGAGGAGASDLSQRGVAGGSSSFGAVLTAIGGGGGASPAGVGGNGTAGNGASGGGGSGNQPNINSGGSGTSGQGSNGGNGYSFSMRSGGGGGGAGSVGTAGTDGVAGIGGAGATSTITGTSTVYAKGGSGIVMSCCGGHAGASGAANTGNGGDAGHTVGAGTPAGSGGSGIVVIRYASTSLSATGGTVTTGGGDVIHTFTSSGTFTVVSVGGSEYATSSESYAYNALGNIIIANIANATTTYSYAGTGYTNPHAVTAIGNGTATTTYAYDNNGNLTSSGTTTYAYDYANRMIQAVGNGATTTFGYDYSGQRVFSQIASSTTVFPSKYFSITSRVIATTTYATSTSYIFGNDQLVAYVEQDLINGTATGTPRTFYVHPDHLGSTNVVTDENGTVVQVLDYYPYGSTRINSSTGGADTKKKFASMERDSNTGLDYAKMRYYDNSRGQFLSEDPSFLAVGDQLKLLQVTGRTQSGFLADPQLMNSYSWGRDNPITNKDPDGNFSIGVSYNAGVEGGFGAYSAANGSTNFNLVVNPSTRQVYVVQSNSGAVNSGYMNNYQSAPDNGKAPFVLGLYGGAGFSVNYSPNMTNPNDIQGTQDSINVNVPLVSFSAQGAGTNNPTYSLSPGAKGVASVSQYPVYTQTTRTYSVNQYVNNAVSQASSYYQSAISSIQAQISSIQGKINELKASLSGKKN